MKKIPMFLLVVCMSGQVALAEKMSMPTLTPDQREKMAGAHEKMAVCLRSDKPVNDCHEEMMKSCKEVMGKDGCGMMHGMMSGKNKGPHNHVKHEDESESKTTH